MHLGELFGWWWEATKMSDDDALPWLLPVLGKVGHTEYACNAISNYSNCLIVHGQLDKEGSNVRGEQGTWQTHYSTHIQSPSFNSQHPFKLHVSVLEKWLAVASQLLVLHFIAKEQFHFFQESVQLNLQSLFVFFSVSHMSHKMPESCLISCDID